MSSTENRFELIEIGRGVAALLVVCFHATVTIALPKYFGQVPLGGLFSFGYAGVDFFFVLSGFIIFYSTAKNHGRSSAILSYIKHRFVRIYPIYWVVGLLLLPLTYLMGHHVGADNAVMDFLLLPREGFPFIPVAWTLRHEVLFYISFLLFFVNVTLAWGYFLLWGGAIAVCSLNSLVFVSAFPSLYFNDHNLEFLLGIGVAQYAKCNQVSWIKPAVLFIVGATIFIGAALNEVPDLFVFDMFNASWSSVAGMPVVSVYESPFYGVNGWLKRVEDVLLGSLILLLIAPLMVLIAFGIKLTSPGVVLFKQRRYGLKGEIVEIWKFRSMSVCDDGVRVAQAQKHDVRVTPFGAFLRRTSLDELPQFINVLQGQMSIVGPRPHAVAHNEEYRRLIHGYMLRHKVKPGITGWAQVNGWRGETDTLDKMQQRVDCDLAYVRNWSLWLDMKIILMTVFKGFSGKNVY